MFKEWIALTKNLGQQGSEGGVIIQDEELHKIARVTVERKPKPESNLDYYCVTIGVFGLLVHTAFFSSEDNALEGSALAKLLIQALYKED